MISGNEKQIIRDLASRIKELSQKPNINTLKPKEVFDRSYVISVK